MRILLIEDNFNYGDSLVRYFEELARYDVKWTRSFAAAVLALVEKTADYDAIILDYELDNGYTAVDVLGIMEIAGVTTPTILNSGLTRSDIDLPNAYKSVDTLQQWLDGLHPTT